MVTFFVWLLASAPAQAAPTPPGQWNCQATSLNVGLLNLGVLEPLLGPLATANDPYAPCADDTSTLNDIGTLPAGIGATALTAQTADGATPDANLQSPSTQTPTAHAQTADLDITLLAINNLLTVGATDTTVSGACVSGVPTLTSSGFATGIRVAGQDLGLDGTVLDPVSRRITLDPLLGTVAHLTINEVVQTSTELVRNAVHLEVVNALNVTLLDVVVGQSKIAYENLPCTDASPTVLLTDSGVNRQLTATVTPFGDHTITSCSFDVTESSSTTTTVTGGYDASTGT